MPRIAKKSGTYHHGDLRRVLLETAVRVVEADGLSALSLQALTRRAGVSSGAPYHHFQNREQLLGAIAQQGFELLVIEMKRAAAEAEAVAEPDHDAAAHLRALGRGYIRFAVAHRGHFRVMFRAELQASQPDPSPKTSEAFVMLQEAVARCQLEGLAPTGDPMPLVLVAWSTVHGASALWIDGSLCDARIVENAEELAEIVAGTLVELIARRPARSPI